MIDLNDTEVLNVLADLLGLDGKPDRETVIQAAQRCCPQCGAEQGDKQSAAAAYAVMRPEYATVEHLKALRG